MGRERVLSWRRCRDGQGIGAGASSDHRSVDGDESKKCNWEVVMMFSKASELPEFVPSGDLASSEGMTEHKV